MKRNRSNIGSATNFIIICLFILSGMASAAENDTSVAGRVARAYGADLFGNIAALRYTFNVQRDTLHVVRSWEWEPSSGRVTLVNPPHDSHPISYRQSDLPALDTGTLRGTDRMFINDQYWLLFPLHLAWDKGTKIAVDESMPLPIGSGSCRSVTVTYPSLGGYTPGDMFRLFIDSSYHVMQWEYHKANSPDMTLAAKWQKHRWMGPLLVSLERPGKAKNFKVWFTDVAAKLKDIDSTFTDTSRHEGQPPWYPAQ